MWPCRQCWHFTQPEDPLVILWLSSVLAWPIQSCMDLSFYSQRKKCRFFSSFSFSKGVVLDSGDGVSHSVPVFDGYCLRHAVQRFPLAGVDVTMHLKKVFTHYHLLFIFLIYRAEMLIAFGIFSLVKLVPCICFPLRSDERDHTRSHVPHFTIIILNVL